ncbi:MAG TPA: hypothetical protein VHL08_00705 [Dongiaceae bacterium]|jgi:hypothetical protein|nr:hypothetical protein [Dongiaceae bacterium]
MYLSVGEGRFRTESIFVGIIHDITERQATAKRMQELQAEHEEAIVRLHESYDFIQRRLHIVYIDKLDDKIDSEFYEHIVANWRNE